MAKLKPYQALYNFVIKGYLTVADILNEIKNAHVEFPKSALLKEELFGAFKGEVG